MRSIFYAFAAACALTALGCELGTHAPSASGGVISTTGSGGGGSGGMGGASGGGGASVEPEVPCDVPEFIDDPNHITLTRISSCGKLQYLKYANSGSELEVHRIPDYSHAGYARGGVPIPDVPVVVQIAPVAGDNTGHIQQVINFVSAMPLGADGLRGTILLEKGTYEIASPLVIRRSGVVLRGETQRPTRQ